MPLGCWATRQLRKGEHVSVCACLFERVRAGELIGFQDATLKRYPVPHRVFYDDGAESAVDVLIHCPTCGGNEDLVESVWDGHNFDFADLAKRGA